MDKKSFVSKVFINTAGDMSVGIFPHEIVIDLGIDVDNFDGYRDMIKKELRQCFNEILDDCVFVVFEDEEMI